MVEHFDVAIVGAGPGGVSAGINASHHNLSHVVLEKGEIANTIHEYQLRKHVMAEPGKLPLAGHLSFRAGTREQVLQTWEQAVREANVNVRQRVHVSRIKKSEGLFKVFYGEGHCTCQSLILALGVGGTPRKQGVPGEDLPHVAYRLADPDAFQDRDILVVGAGDAAIEHALVLAERNRVSIINRGGGFPRAKDANAARVQDAIESGSIRGYYNTTVARIEPEQTILNTPNGEVTVPCSHLIARLGGIPPRKFIESCGVEFPSSKPGAVPLVDSHYESNVKGLYLIGSLIGYPLIKQAINQGHEVIEHILGNPVEPADQVLIKEKLEILPGSVQENLDRIRLNLPLFRDLSDPQFRELIYESSLRVKNQGQLVFRRNDYSDTLFNIIEGRVLVELPDDDLPEDQWVEIGPGDFFGEMGLLSGRRRSATVHVAEQSLFLETPRKQIQKLINSVDSVKRALDEIFVFRALQTSIFPGVHSKFLKDLSRKAALNHLKKGDVLFKEGDEGDSFHVIRKGEVRISRRINGLNITQTYLPAGNYVGEMSVLNPEPGLREATVTAVVACDTLVIGKPDFLDFVKQHPDARERISRVAEKRRIENLAFQSSESSAKLLDFMLGKGLSDADNVLIIDSDLCVSCDNCEQACAATHNGCSRLDRNGGESFSFIQVPTSCRHCENPLCMLDCPPDALTRQPNGEIIIRDSCIGCGNCQQNCPYGVIQMVHDTPPQGKKSLFSSWFKPRVKEEGPPKAAKCDMCIGLKGGPACVRSCPTGAAMRVEPAKLFELAGQTQGFWK
ncbi:MAG: NAD(P)-binding domain-containing protein [Nitrospinaceae bacterium]